MTAHQSHSPCLYPMLLIPSITEVPKLSLAVVLKEGQHPQYITIRLAPDPHGQNSHCHPGMVQPALTSVATQGSQAEKGVYMRSWGRSEGFQAESG